MTSLAVGQPGMDLANPYEGCDIASWLVELARRRGAHPFLVWEPMDAEGRTYTYEAFLDLVRKLAGGLASRGVKPGDRVIVHMENCPETILMRFACAWSGAVCVATNPLAAGPEVAYFAQSSGAVCAVTQPKFADMFAEHCPGLSWIAVVDEGPADSHSRAETDRMVPFSSLIGEPLPQRIADPLAPASVMFTTGSTSRPKGVMWTHANVLWAAEANCRQQEIREDDIHLLFLPLFHVVGLSWCFFSTMWAGGTIVLQPGFSRSRYWPVAMKHRATVGSHVHFTLAALRAEPVPDHAFRRWVTSTHDRAAMAHYGVDMVAGWGMTEVLIQVLVSRPEQGALTGGIGRPSLFCGVKVVDDNGSPVRPGEAGNLLVKGVRGLSIFREYDGDVAATDASFDDQGFLITGDRVRLKEEGWFEFTDRVKDVIKVRGENVSAAEVEAVILKVPGVREVAVVGKASEMQGEYVVAFVGQAAGLSDDQAQALPGTILEHCSRNIARFKIPKEIHVVAKLPRIGIGKLAKATLREWAASGGVGQAGQGAPRTAFESEERRE
ncbi:class I adenylate-forming enzyme family protein [Cupriavidus sp. 2TAF22]|uniref:class I adenylate-forming enzyme family protein n=1 Tax=unclassified Cupriavidus TaxID=2640874 RepID=UPI003F8E1EC9